MNMSQRWKQEHELLRDFIAAHPEIVITANEVSIPQDLREEFYSRFDSVRRALVEDHFPALPVEIDGLCGKYRKVEREILEILGLDAITVPVDLSTFLRNPKEGLTRVVYNTLFDFLQGKISGGDFEAQTAGELAAAAADLYRLGYEQWAALTVIRLLDPDEGFQVDFDEEYTPVATELKTIAFGRQAHHPTLRVPEFMFRSRKLNTYVAVKMPLIQELPTYVVTYRPPVRPRKKTGDTSSVLDSRALLLYFLPTRDDIPVVVDIYEGNRKSPDWMIEFMGAEELENPESLSQVQQGFEALNPKAGTCLLVVGPTDEANLRKIPETIHAVAAGLDPSKLQSFVDGCLCAGGAPDPSDETTA